ncbi:MAG: glutathione S-transferase family protein [Myxococcota bacterium]
MLRVISFKICPFVQRVTAMLEAKGVPHHVEFISLRDKPQWFLDLSPNGQVPVLVTEGGEALFESDAIVEYLDEVYPRLVERTPEQRAADRAWSYQASKHYLVQCSAQRSADAPTLEERSGKLGKAFAKADRALGEGPYFNGEIMGNVDLAWLPLLHRASIIEARSGHDFIAAYPKVKAWQAAMLRTGLADKSVASDFEEAFAGFYLSDQTYLGRSARAPTIATASG